MWRRVLALGGVGLVMLLVMAGCGDDDDNKTTPSLASPGSATTINVSLKEYRIEMPAELAAGQVTFAIKNDGKEEHSLEIAGDGTDAVLPKNLKPGEATTLVVTLKAGEYKVSCPVDGHDELGMERDIEVK